METQEIANILNGIFKFIGVAGVVIIIIGIALVITFLIRMIIQNHRFKKHLKEGDPVKFYKGEEKHYGRVTRSSHSRFFTIEHFDINGNCNRTVMRHISDLCPRLTYNYKP